MFRRLTTINPMFAALLATAVLLLSSVASAQQSQQTQTTMNGLDNSETAMRIKEEAAPKALETTPVYTSLMGVSLGMSAAEVRGKLKKAKDQSDTQDLFVFSDSKSAQIFYGPKGKVVAISIDYVGKNSDAPSAEEVLGEAVQARADGSLYALKRYPEAGYWVAYSRTAGENHVTSVTVQKM